MMSSTPQVISSHRLTSSFNIEDDFHTGTITFVSKISARLPSGLCEFTSADLLLDKPFENQKYANIVIFSNNLEIVGNRIRAKFFVSEEAKMDILSHGIWGYTIAYNHIKNCGLSFDFRTAHLTHDDPMIIKTRHPVESNLSVLGVHRGYDDYYRHHGYKIMPVQRIELPLFRRPLLNRFKSYLGF